MPDAQNDSNYSHLSVRERLEAAIEGLLDERAAGSSICPSEAAKAVEGDQWRDLMDESRSAAQRLVTEGRAQITQAGLVVDPLSFVGPIRIRRPQ